MRVELEELCGDHVTRTEGTWRLRRSGSKPSVALASGSPVEGGGIGGFEGGLSADARGWALEFCRLHLRWRPRRPRMPKICDAPREVVGRRAREPRESEGLFRSG